MKIKLLLTSMLLALSWLFSTAADYVPMIREDRVWEYVGTFLAPEACGNVFHYMKFDGTMDVQGTEYHKFVLFKSIFESDGEYIKGGERQEPYYLLREEEGKVYVLCQNDEIARNYNPGSQNATENLSEFKLYDFTLSNGEVIEYPICSWEVSQNAERLNYYVNVFSPLEIDGERCRLMALSREPVDNPDYDYSFPVRIIEGIGATYNGSLVNFCLEMFGSIFDSSYEPTYYSTINRVLDLDGNVVYGEGSAPPCSVDGVLADGTLTLRCSGDSLVAVADGDAVVTLEIVGIDGAKRASASGRGQAVADLSQLAPGVYVVRASDGSSVKTAKIMINYE